MLQQLSAITIINLRSLPKRWGDSLVTIVGIGCVVGVFMGLFAVIEGYSKLMNATASPDSFIVLREGAQSELSSPLHSDEVPHIVNSEFVKHDDQGPLASPEFLWYVQLPRSDTENSVMVGFRGVTPAAYRVRENFKLVEGRKFETGLNEILVGRRAMSQYKGLEVGNHVQLMGTDWKVVGVFADNLGMSESELWVDLPILQNLLPWGEEYQSVRLKMINPEQVSTYNQELAKNPQVLSSAQSETDYYSLFTKQLSDTLTKFSIPLIVIMCLGAIAAAVNTMYNSVAVRTKEIATLRSLGFSPFPVAISTLAESLILAAIGGIIASALIYIFFNGYTAITTSNNNQAVQFEFAVTPALIAQGISCALIVGLIGGFFPAIRASRLPIATALRES